MLHNGQLNGNVIPSTQNRWPSAFTGRKGKTRQSSLSAVVNHLKPSILWGGQSWPASLPSAPDLKNALRCVLKCIAMCSELLDRLYVLQISSQNWYVMFFGCCCWWLGVTYVIHSKWCPSSHSITVISTTVGYTRIYKNVQALVASLRIHLKFVKTFTH